MTRVGVPRAHGTFTEEALLTQPDLAAGEAVPVPRRPDVIAAVERGEVDVGLVPIENTIEGSVTVTLDTLAFDSELLDPARGRPAGVAATCARRPGTKLADITHGRVASRTRSRQCRGCGCAKKLPDAESRSSRTPPPRRPREVSKSKRTDHGRDRQRARGASSTASRCSPRDIEDHPENQTRFVLVGRGRPRADRPRQDVDRLLPAPGPARLAARDPAGVRGPRDQPHQARVAPDQARASATTASSSTSRATSPTRSSPTPAQPRGQAGRGEVPRLVPGRRADGGARRAARPSAKAWTRRRRVGRRRCARRSADDGRAVIDLKRLRDEPEYRARHRTQAGARRADRRGARGRRRAPRRSSARSRSCAPGRTRRRRRSARPRPTSARRRSRPPAALKDELTRARSRSSQAVDARAARARAAGAEPGRRVGARRRRGRRRGAARSSATTPAAPALDHAAFGEAMGFVDTEQARAEASGSRFAYLMREAVLLELALVQWVMAHARRATASRRSCRRCSCASARWRRPGFFPTDRAQVYDVDDGELFLVGTSEVPLSALHRGETLDADDAARALRRLSPRASGARPAPTARTRAASSACTSSTRSRCSRTAHPDESWDEHERILAIEESIIGGLGLPYRVVNIAAGDLGAGRGEEVRHRGVAAVGGRVPRAHVVLELPRLLGAPARRRA